MKTLTLIFALVALSSFSLDTHALKKSETDQTSIKGGGIRKGVVVEIDNSAGKIIDGETGEIHAFNRMGNGNDQISIGKSFYFHVIEVVKPGAPSDSNFKMAVLIRAATQL